MAQSTKYSFRSSRERLSRIRSEYLDVFEAWHLLLIPLNAYYPMSYVENIVLKFEDRKASPSKIEHYCIGAITICSLCYSFLSTYLLLDKDIQHLLRNRVSSVLSAISGTQPAEKGFLDAHGGVSIASRAGQASQVLERPQLLPLHISDTDAAVGLTSDEVLVRQEFFGPNEIKGGSLLPWVKSTCSYPSHIMISAAAIFALILYEYRHMFCLCLTLCISVWMPYRSVRDSAKAIQSFGWRAMKDVEVRRDGTLKEVSVRDLVPGDVVSISEDMRVPADGRLLTIDDTLIVDQSAVGDSLPVEKSPGNTCFATTRITRGKALLIVEDIGYSTKIGRKIAWMPGRTEYNYPRQIGKRDHVLEYKRLISSVGLMFLCICISPVFLRRKTSFSDAGRLALQILMVATSYGGAETLPRIEGSTRLIKDGCLCPRPDVIDALAGVDVFLCEDRGILTKNKQTILEPYCLSGNAEQILTVAYLAQAPGVEKVDLIAKAISNALSKVPGTKASADLCAHSRHDPMNSTTLKSISFLEKPDQKDALVCTAGAPKAVLAVCLNYMSEEDGEVASEKYRNAVVNFVSKGCRTLGVARKRGHGPWELLGVLPIWDPPRVTSPQSLRIANQLGVSVRTITGNAAAIAKKTAEDIGMVNPRATTEPIVGRPRTAKLETQEPVEVVEDADVYADVYAECFSEDKMEIVKRLQRQNHRVAITSDGLENVLTIRQADFSIAPCGEMITGQDHSDMVMIKPGFSRIVNNIRSCRQIFQQAHNKAVEQVTRNLHRMLAMLWYFHIYAELAPFGTILIRADLVESIKTVWPRTSLAEMSVSLKPVRWNLGTLISEALILTTILALGYPIISDGHFLKGLTFSQSQISSYINITKPAVLLYFVLPDCWMPLVIDSDGQLLSFRNDVQKAIALTLVQALLTVASVYGWLGESQLLSAGLACRVWLLSFCAFAACVFARRITSRTGRVDVPDHDDEEPAIKAGRA